ncbi:hypothetical protein GQ53DRAFT_666147 [Thozetella sp. PMI_491]|nr:hypothetical protein GQ53DRAFT_666147 [Thozetella sp. PMI_491]
MLLPHLNGLAGTAGGSTPGPSSSSSGLPLPRKRQRKSRGRGLRTKTGCLTCRSRHKKCDEQRPICGPCSISTRDCVFPDDKLRALGDAADAIEDLEANAAPSFSASVGLPRVPRLDVVSAPDGSPEALEPGAQVTLPTYAQSQPQALSSAADNDAYVSGHSPSATTTSEPWTVASASNRWLDLLATDAAHSGFVLPPGPGDALDGPADEAARGRVGPLGPGDRELLGPPARPVARSPEEHKSWQADRDIVLSVHDAVLLRNFAERSALWLDLLDPHKHFSNDAIRLALRNHGLMRAILALSARHLALLQGKARTRAQMDAQMDGDDISESIQYYYETLHFVQNNLQHHSYTRSEQLLVTALVISTYEMLDEADGRGNWQRHLKGVFWIQRSQDVNGGSGGIRQAVWWAWLRQDLWAAFREKRRCLSFWKPVKDYPDLGPDDLADRSVYLLSQAVNYCADAKEMEKSRPNDAEAAARRVEAGDHLLAMLERWKSFLGERFRPLPTPPRPEDVFRPIWIHPPQFGVALQVYSFARILIMLHRPAHAGFNGYLRVQRTLSEAVETICGIAMELKSEGCQIVSAQCLYGAGLCVQDPTRREKIISMIEDCEAKTGWPMAPWRQDLRQEWAKLDLEYQEPSA